MNAYIPELLTVLLEDIPQLSIGYHILQCRGQTINSVARVKAGFLLCGAVLYSVYTVITWRLHLDHYDNAVCFLFQSFGTCLSNSVCIILY